MKQRVFGGLCSIIHILSGKRREVFNFDRRLQKSFDNTLCACILLHQENHFNILSHVTNILDIIGNKVFVYFSVRPELVEGHIEAWFDKLTTNGMLFPIISILLEFQSFRS